MNAKVVDLKAERQRRRQKTGWSLAEIEQRVAERRAANKRAGRAEPDELASGADMKQLAENPDDDQE
jgi:hypothetical protein